jgi:hypothetical protein
MQTFTLPFSFVLCNTVYLFIYLFIHLPIRFIFELGYYLQCCLNYQACMREALYKPWPQLSITGILMRTSASPRSSYRDRPAMLHFPAAAVIYVDDV